MCINRYIIITPSNIIANNFLSLENSAYENGSIIREYRNREKLISLFFELFAWIRNSLALWLWSICSFFFIFEFCAINSHNIKYLHFIVYILLKNEMCCIIGLSFEYLANSRDILGVFCMWTEYAVRHTLPIAFCRSHKRILFVTIYLNRNTYKWR